MKNRVRIILVLIFSLPLILVTGCDNEFPDYYQEKSFALGDFESVELGDAFQVEILRTEGFSVIAKGEIKDLKDLQLEVVDGILVGNYKPGTTKHKRTLVQISMPVLKSINLHGGASAQIFGFHTHREKIIVQVSEASKVVTDANGEFLDLNIDIASELVVTEPSKCFEASNKKPSRLLGRGSNCKYNYQRIGWI